MNRLLIFTLQLLYPWRKRTRYLLDKRLGTSGPI